MNQKSLALWLKIIIVLAALIGAVAAFLFIPAYGRSIADVYPEMSYCYYPWLAFEILFSLPCFAALFFGWKIAVNIGNDRSFTRENSAYLRSIAILAATDSGYFLLGNWALVFFDMNHPGIALLVAPVLTFFGISASVVFAALSHLIYKAAVLREDSDLTI
ncbi:MAG: DUF2975 domain-containing protein [Oscillospiraceae bacterium]